MMIDRCFRTLACLLLVLAIGACGPGTDAPVDGADTGGDNNTSLDMGTSNTPNNGENNIEGDTGSDPNNNNGADSGMNPDNNDPNCPTAGERMCDGTCIDTLADSDNCGGCGVTCGASATCVAGGCVCDGANDCNGDLGMDGGDGCECAGPCNGTQCTMGGACDYDVAGSCSSEGEWCANGACAPCAAGKKNCDLQGTCECEGDCDGAMCTSMACTYDEMGACNDDDSMWCSSIAQNTCVSCTTGFFNCNNTAGCECDSAGCNGQECAGQCFGGECP